MNILSIVKKIPQINLLITSTWENFKVTKTKKNNLVKKISLWSTIK